MILLVSAVCFVLVHHLFSGTRLRDELVAAAGLTTYRGAFSAMSLLLIVGMAFGYGQALPSDSNLYLWTAPNWWLHAGAIAMFVAFQLAVIGILSPNPGSVGQEVRVVMKIRGIQRITRHPFLWGVALWAIFHLVANGDLAGVILFGSLALTAVLGTFSIDRKRQRAYPVPWMDYGGRTSNFPFVAILTGRQRLALKELGIWRVGMALCLFLFVFFAHGTLFGVAPIGG